MMIITRICIYIYIIYIYVWRILYILYIIYIYLYIYKYMYIYIYIYIFCIYCNIFYIMHMMCTIRFMQKVHNLRNFYIFLHERVRWTLWSSFTSIVSAFFLYTFNHITFTISKIQLWLIVTTQHFHFALLIILNRIYNKSITSYL